MGVAGAGVDSNILLTSGIAGLLAGSLSMAAGEYVSVRSQREMYEYQIGLERDELAEYPEEEAEELALIYNARGLPLHQARVISRQLLTNPQHALDTLAREELGLNPDDLGSPFAAAGSSFAAFAIGATTYNVGTGARMGPGYFPLILSVLMAILGGFVLFKSLTIEVEGGDPIGHVAWRPLLVIVAAIAVFGLALPRLGLVITVPILILMTSLAGDEFKWKGVLATAVVLTVGSWAIFVLGLKLVIPMWPWFVG
jgi:VIT1/CCC1 family predicted Fe2+/Mn2+ transporter